MQLNILVLKNFSRKDSASKVMKKYTISTTSKYKDFLSQIKIGFAVLLIFFASTSISGYDGNVDNSFQGNVLTLATVQTVVTQPDGKILIGGNMLAVNGLPSRSIARLNSDGNIDSSFNPPPVTGTVYSITLQPDGKIIVGGGNFILNGQQRLGVFRLNSDGSSDVGFNTGAGATSGAGSVFATALQSDGKIIIGGNFDSYNNVFRNGIARINADGTLDTSFTPSTVGESANEGVYSISIQQDNKIVVVGDFTTIIDGMNVFTKLRVARFNTDGTLDNSFNGSVSSGFRVFNVAIQPDNKIVICGIFTQVNGITRNKIARLNNDGSLDNTFNADIPFGNGVNKVKIQTDGKVLVGGSFNQINGVTKSNLARLNSNGTLDTTFITTSDGTVYDIIPSDNPIIVGEFTKINNIDSFGVSRVDNNGNRDNSFNVGTGTNGIVRKLAVQPDNKILVGGEFLHFFNSSRRNIGRFNIDGTLDTTFNPGTGFAFGSRVNDIAVSNTSKIAVVGNFATFNSATQRLIVLLNADGSRDTSFNANFTQNGEITKVMFYPGNKLLIVGSFRFGGETQFNSLALLNADGTRDISFIPTFTGGSVQSVAVQSDGKIIAAGSFTTVNGAPQNYIVRLNPNGSVDNSLNLSVQNYFSFSIGDIYLQSDGKILITGFFQRSGSQPESVLRLNSDGSRDVLFNLPTGKNFDTKLAIQQDGRIIISLRNNFVSGISQGSVVRLKTNGSIDYSFDVNSTGIITNNGQYLTSLAVMPDNRVIIGGYFTSYGNVRRLSIVRLENALLQPPAIFDFDGDSKTDIGIFRPSVGEWWLNRSSTSQTVAFQFGSSSDKIVPADYTGDGKTDLAFFRPGSGQWFVLRSEDSTFYAFPFGVGTDVSVPADYDGDGRADAAVFRESSLTWFINKSSGGTDIIGFGATGDKPTVADYDGDGKADIAIFRPNGASGAEWWIRRSSNGSVFALQFGNAADKPVQGDYTGDGKADIAFFRPSNSNWFILRSENFSFFAFPFGAAGDVPVAGDYDGDGKFDAGVFRPSTNTWFIQRSTAGTLIQQFGINGDLPVPNAFVP